MLNFVKNGSSLRGAKRRSNLLVILSLVIFASFALGEGVPFLEVAGPPAPPTTPNEPPPTQSQQIGQLKYQAVVNYIQKYLGPRYPQFEKAIGKDFGEKFVLDYKVGRQGKDKTLELSGHLDSDGIKRWVRTMEAKSKGSASMNPILLVSSPAAELSLNASSTGTRARTPGAVQTIQGLVNSALHKWNVRTTAMDLPRMTVSQPVTNTDDVRWLRDQGIPSNFNGVIWLQLAPCKSCGGFRLDTYVYNLTHGRVVLSRSDDVTLNASDLSNANTLKNALKQPMAALASDYEEAVQSGALFSSSYSLKIEGLEGYRSMRGLEGELNQLDFVSRPIIQRAESKSVTFEVLSTLSPEEISQRIGETPFAGFKLTPVRVDSKTLVVRYSK